MKNSIRLKDLTDLIMDQARKKGFGVNADDIVVAEKIALIHSEISEAYDAYRNKNIHGKDGFEEELGDALQRILHLCGVMNFNIEKSILNKLDSNKKRKWSWDKLNENNTR